MVNMVLERVCVVDNTCVSCIGLTIRWNVIFWQLSVFGCICVQTRNASDSVCSFSREKGEGGINVNVVSKCHPSNLWVVKRLLASTDDNNFEGKSTLIHSPGSLCHYRHGCGWSSRRP